MISRIEIQNYRCFPDLTTELRPLTVLIGQNNTGKSAFLDAILALRPDPNRELTRSDHWRLNANAVVEIRAYADGSPEPILFRSDDEKTGKRRIRRDDSPAPSIGQVSFFRLPSSGVVCRHEGFSDTVKKLPLNERGDQLAALLDYMLRNDRKRFDGVVATLQDLVAGFEDLLVPTPDAKTRHIRVVLDNGLQLPGESLSVGLRHLIFFVTLAYHPRAPQVILVEEPELGVHPKRLGDILRLLRSISQGEHCDNAAQVILTTHSPFLLDYVDLDQDQLLIFQREDSGEGARIARPVDKERLNVFLDEFMLGEVWFNESEEGLVGQQ